MTTTLDIIKGSLRSIGALGTGEQPDPDTANDAFTMLNDMLASWSNEHMLVYCTQEVMHELVSGTYIYTIGAGGNIGASITGSIANNTLTVTALASGALSVGQTVAGTGVLAGTEITSYDTGRGSNGNNALGTYYVNRAQTVLSTTLTTYANVETKWFAMHSALAGEIVKCSSHALG